MDTFTSQLSLKPASFAFPTTTSSLKKSNSFNSISCKAASTTNNLYQILSLVSEKVGLDEIKKAYRSMARKYHPDVVPASRKEECTKKFVELQKAYETLSDPVSRHKYDLSGCGCGGMQNQETNFSRQTWEEQLLGLQFKSNTPRNARTRTRTRTRRAYV